ATYKSEKVFLVYVAAGIGNITESDVKMAQSAGAAVYGFNVSATPVAKRLAESGAVNIKTYTIIYQLVDEIKKQLLALLPTETIRTDLGTLTVLALFRTEKERMIIGGRVTKGHVAIGANLDVVRGERVIGTGKLSKVQHNKIDVNEVKQDKECGLTFEGATKIKVGDLLMCYTEEEQPKVL
ncbi:MAG TPA: translation initiation factor IF-2, partial [Patescibacteria group bacterium]|nr:translation initiation factor IF-2 [Patescibacteria group bacterium]